MATSSVPKRRCFTSNQATNFWGVLLLMAEIRLTHQLRLVVYPIIHKVLYIPGGSLGFLPSTVCSFRRSTKPEKGKHVFFRSSIRQSHILDHVLCVVQQGRNWPIRRLWCCYGFHLGQPYNRLLLLEEIPDSRLTSIRNPVNNGDIYHISNWFCRIFSRSTASFNSFRPVPTWLLLHRTHIYPNVKFGWESLASLKCWKIDSFALSRLLINPGPTLLEKKITGKPTGVLVQLQAEKRPTTSAHFRTHQDTSPSRRSTAFKGCNPTWDPPGGNGIP